jgi:hypothetical protein
VLYDWRHKEPQEGAGLPGPMLVRFVEDDDGRLEPIELCGLEPLTADSLRAVPIGRIAAWANAPEVGPQIRRHINEPGPGDAVSTQSRATGRVKPLDRWSSARLRIPDKRPYGDEFYGQVAAKYSALAEQTSRPAAELAEVNGLKAATVHKWIREARRREFLPPGRQGKRG